MTRTITEPTKAAAEAGAVLDRERGWIDQDGETLAGYALRLRTEISGPAGRE